MKKNLILLPLLLALSCISITTQGWAYQEIEVKNGGTIQGKATMIGKMPFPRIYNLILFPKIDLFLLNLNIFLT